MKTLYVVTAGAYSAYHLCGVFDDKELAELFVSRYNASLRAGLYHHPDNEAGIEEHELNPHNVDLRAGYVCFFVRMNKTGEALETEISMPDDDSLEGYDVQGNLILKCWANDSQHAVKIANERRTRILAENRWGKEN